MLCSCISLTRKSEDECSFYETSLHIRGHNTYLLVVCLMLFAIRFKCFTPQKNFMIAGASVKIATRELSKTSNYWQSLVTYIWTPKKTFF